MKNFILIIFLTSLVFAPLPAVLAFTPGTVPGDKEIISAGSPITKPDQFLNIIASVVKYTYAIFFIITVMFVLFAAFNYLTGGDEPEKIKSSHKQIMYAAIAVSVALLAVGFSLIIKQFLNPSGGGSATGSKDYTQYDLPIGPTRPNR